MQDTPIPSINKNKPTPIVQKMLNRTKGLFVEDSKKWIDRLKREFLCLQVKKGTTQESP